MDKQTVRIGVAIRNEHFQCKTEGRFILPESLSVLTSNDDLDFTARTVSNSKAARWGVRLKSFQEKLEADKFAEQIKGQFEKLNIHKLGVPVTLSNGKTLNNSIWTVTAGNWESEQEARLKSKEFDHELLYNCGLIKYSDQVVQFEPIIVEKATGGAIEIENLKTGEKQILPSPLVFKPENDKSIFHITDVRIGIEFHWDHKETLKFDGVIELHADSDKITAVNEINLERYLLALLGSEMRPDWHENALAAQAVAARSTVLATRGRHHYNDFFDLCHDDHCQCYQGITRYSETAAKALTALPEKILVFEDRVADARYSKSCGGRSEYYSICWEDWDIPYMTSVPCGPLHNDRLLIQDEMKWQNEAVFKHILSHPPKGAACNPESVVYPESSKEMEVNYRWQFTLSQDKIKQLIKERLSKNLGKIKNIQALERGHSGRISYIRLFGDRGTITVGKELNIRRLFSDSHLPSSAFTIDFDTEENIIINGLGWGHGAGLCQLGSNALAENKWSAEKILELYYPGSRLEDL